MTRFPQEAITQGFHEQYQQTTKRSKEKRT